MLYRSRINFFMFSMILLLLCCITAAGLCDTDFQIRRVGNIHSYGDNAFQISTSEGGELKISVHDSVCVYRTIVESVPAGDTVIHWDGCGYNQEKLYEKNYTITAEMTTDSGAVHTVAFSSPVEYPMQCLQYAMPSSYQIYLDNPNDWFLEYRTVTDGMIHISFRQSDTEDGFTYSLKTEGGKIARKDFTAVFGKNPPAAGSYSVSIYEVSRPEQSYQYTITVSDSTPETAPVAVTGEIMPDRSMTDEEIWQIMMKPSVVVDIDFFKHQDIYAEPDTGSKSLGTVHGQTQGLKVIQIDNGWALVGAWNHEEADYVEGWVPLSTLKTVYPAEEYGILIDKQKQTLSVYHKGNIMDTLLISSGRAEKKHLERETSAGCFLTGYHRVNFSMNGKKYDYVIQYDGGNLLHQTPYDWGQQKKDFTLGRGYLGAKASHACIRIQPEPGKGGLNAFWIFTHIPYHTRIIILDDPEEREAMISRLKRTDQDIVDISSLNKSSCSSPDSGKLITVTFGGCFIPGGISSFNRRIESFISYLSENGYDKPLKNIKRILENDDLSCVCLYGFISANSVINKDEKGILTGTEAVREIFSHASIDMIQMTDACYTDSAEEHVQNTVNILSPFTSVLQHDNDITVELKGHLFGFAGFSEKEYLKNPSVIDERIQKLKNKKCETIVALASWGDSNASEHTIVQEAMAHRCVRAGANLVIGNSRDKLQGIDYIEGIPVVYSTGFLLDGSTSRKPKTQQGILVRAVFDPDNNASVLSIIPILPYGNISKDRNDYTPVAELSRAEMERLIRCIWNDTPEQVMNRIHFQFIQ